MRNNNFSINRIHKIDVLVPCTSSFDTLAKLRKYKLYFEGFVGRSKVTNSLSWEYMVWIPSNCALRLQTFYTVWGFHCVTNIWFWNNFFWNRFLLFLVFLTACSSCKKVIFFSTFSKSSSQYTNQLSKELIVQYMKKRTLKLKKIEWFIPCHNVTIQR